MINFDDCNKKYVGEASKRTSKSLSAPSIYAIITWTLSVAIVFDRYRIPQTYLAHLLKLRKGADRDWEIRSRFWLDRALICPTRVKEQESLHVHIEFKQSINCKLIVLFRCEPRPLLVCKPRVRIRVDFSNVTNKIHIFCIQYLSEFDATCFVRGKTVNIQLNKTSLPFSRLHSAWYIESRCLFFLSSIYMAICSWLHAITTKASCACCRTMAERDSR